MLSPSLLVICQGWGLIDFPLRASNEFWFIWSISSIWLVGPEIHPEEPDGPERPANQTDEPVRVARAQGTHPLADLAETLALSIEAYEATHVAIPDAAGPDILRSLMEEHELTQSDLPKIGSQGVVSEILSGKRDLNVRQIAQLAAQFGVSPTVFMPPPARTAKPRSTKTRKLPVR